MTKEEFKAYRAVYNVTHKDTTAAYKARNKERIAAVAAAWYDKHKAECYKPEYVAKYMTARKAADPLFKLASCIRSRTSNALKRKSWRKTSSFKEYIGCAPEELKSYLESQFQSGMSWDNYGQWHVDHIIPLVSATTTEELLKLCHYTNLQPLWALDNLRKGGR